MTSNTPSKYLFLEKRSEKFYNLLSNFFLLSLNTGDLYSSQTKKNEFYFKITEELIDNLSSSTELRFCPKPGIRKTKSFDTFLNLIENLTCLDKETFITLWKKDSRNILDSNQSRQNYLSRKIFPQTKSTFEALFKGQILDSSKTENYTLDYSKIDDFFDPTSPPQTEKIFPLIDYFIVEKNFQTALCLLTRLYKTIKDNDTHQSVQNTTNPQYIIQEFFEKRQDLEIYLSLLSQEISLKEKYKEKLIKEIKTLSEKKQ